MCEECLKPPFDFTEKSVEPPRSYRVNGDSFSTMRGAIDYAKRVANASGHSVFVRYPIDGCYGCSSVRPDLPAGSVMP